jgi:hypothetical protein
MTYQRLKRHAGLVADYLPNTPIYYIARMAQKITIRNVQELQQKKAPELEGLFVEVLPSVSASGLFFGPPVNRRHHLTAQQRGSDLLAQLSRCRLSLHRRGLKILKILNSLELCCFLAVDTGAASVNHDPGCQICTTSHTHWQLPVSHLGPIICPALYSAVPVLYRQVFTRIDSHSGALSGVSWANLNLTLEGSASGVESQSNLICQAEAFD